MNGLLVGRFQPFHLGHIEAIRFALVRSESLWLCIGSSNAPQDAKNPFSLAERQEMIDSSLDDDTAQRVRVYAIPDYDDHARWIEEIDATVPEYSVVYTNDETSAAMFRRRSRETVEIALASRETLEGSRIRAEIAAGRNVSDLVPAGTARVLAGIGAPARLAAFNYK